MGWNSIVIKKDNKLPNRVMLNNHPHNWTDNKAECYKMLFWQSSKNIVNRIYCKS